MFQEKYTTIGAQTIHYVEGPENGPPIVITHGSTATMAEMAGLAEALAPSWHVFSCDQRGHGKSGKGAAYRCMDFFPDTAGFVREVIGRPTILAGHSLGALTSIGAAALAPEMVSAVILLDPPLFLRRESLRNTYFYTIFAGFSDYVFGKRSAREAIYSVIPDIDQAGFEIVKANLDRVDPAFIKTLVDDQLMDGWDMTAAMQNIKCPTLLLYGEVERGAAVFAGDLADYHALLPHGQSRQIKGAGHLVLLDRPDDVVEQVKAFLVKA